MRSPWPTSTGSRTSASSAAALAGRSRRTAHNGVMANDRETFNQKVRLIFQSCGSRERPENVKREPRSAQGRPASTACFYVSPGHRPRVADVAAEPARVRAAAVPGLVRVRTCHAPSCTLSAVSRRACPGTRLGRTPSARPPAPCRRAQGPTANPLPIPNYPVGRLVKDLRARRQDRRVVPVVRRPASSSTRAGGPGGHLARRAVDPLPVGGHGLGQCGHGRHLAASPAQHPRCWLRTDSGAAGRAGSSVMASSSPIYAAPSPLGPFAELGRPKLPAGLPETIDPNAVRRRRRTTLTSTGAAARLSGIYGHRARRSRSDAPDRPRRSRSSRSRPTRHPWERVGEWQPATGTPAGSKARG
ncbi:MAG: hypothetical protein MZV63_23585 [Marinilabiliales bacterium]|nr:hypothetical protein [Marinilabiliales bacterium]